MRSIFIVFKKASRAEVVRDFDARFARNGVEWIRDGSVYIGFYDDAEVEFEPELFWAAKRSLHPRREEVVRFLK